MPYLKYLLLFLSSAYTSHYFYVGFDTSLEYTTGLFFFLTVPLAVVQIALSIWCFGQKAWQKIVSIIGILIGVTILIQFPLLIFLT